MLTTKGHLLSNSIESENFVVTLLHLQSKKKNLICSSAKRENMMMVNALALGLTLTFSAVFLYNCTFLLLFHAFKNNCGDIKAWWKKYIYNKIT